MNRDVFLSILSMDSYNRGGDGLNLGNVHIGSANYIGEDENPSTGYFASRYSWNGETVISYRGTVLRVSHPFGAAGSS